MSGRKKEWDSVSISIYCMHVFVGMGRQALGGGIFFRSIEGGTLRCYESFFFLFYVLRFTVMVHC